MFKARVKKWGLDKKNKAVEMEAIFRAKQERDAIGKKSVFYVRGKVVDFAEVRRYRRRKGLKPDTKMRPNVTSKNILPPSVRCVTPEILAAPNSENDEILPLSTLNCPSGASLTLFPCSLSRDGPDLSFGWMGPDPLASGLPFDVLDLIVPRGYSYCSIMSLVEQGQQLLVSKIIQSSSTRPVIASEGQNIMSMKPYVHHERLETKNYANCSGVSLHNHLNPRRDAVTSPHQKSTNGSSSCQRSYSPLVVRIPLTPPEFRIPENIFRSIQNYIHGSFELGSWAKFAWLAQALENVQTGICGAREKKTSMHGVETEVVFPQKGEIRVFHRKHYLTTFWFRCVTAGRLFHLGQNASAVSLLDKASMGIDGILKEQHPQLMLNLFHFAR